MSQYLSGKEAVIRLFGEYAIKLLLVITGCGIALIAVISYLKFCEKPMDIRDVIIIGGLGYTAVVKFYFGKSKVKNQLMETGEDEEE